MSEVDAALAERISKEISRLSIPHVMAASLRRRRARSLGFRAPSWTATTSHKQARWRKANGHGEITPRESQFIADMTCRLACDGQPTTRQTP